jgi:transposase-like protein
MSIKSVAELKSERAKRKRYSEEFQREAVRLLESGRPAAQLSRELGVPVWNLGRWRARQCAASAFPQLLPIAETAVASVSSSLAADSNWLKCTERKEFGKPFGPNKARVSVIGAILKPTCATANTYRQHSWITEETLQLPKLGMLTSFLTELTS